MTRLIEFFGFLSTETVVLGALGLVFFSVLCAVIGSNILWNYRQALRRRVAQTGGGDAKADTGGQVSLRYADEIAGVTPGLSPMVRRLVPTDMSKVSHLRQRLVRAGYWQPSSMGIYYLARIGLALGAALAVAFASAFLSGRLSVQQLTLLAVGAVALGYFLPDFWIALRTRSRQRQYREGFPDALDLLVVCVEAGLGLDAALNRVGQEIGAAHRALADNFALIALELRAGTSRADALRNFAERVGIDEVRSMVTLLLQSEELGTSIADALRIYSAEMRTHRMLAAETKAQSLPAKLALPLGFFVFPTMVIVVLMPVMIRIYRVLLHM